MKSSSIIPNTPSQDNPQLNWRIRCILKTKYSAEAYYWLPENTADMIGPWRRPALNSSGRCSRGCWSGAYISGIKDMVANDKLWHITRVSIFVKMMNCRGLALFWFERCADVLNVVPMWDIGSMPKWTSFDMNWLETMSRIWYFGYKFIYWTSHVRISGNGSITHIPGTSQRSIDKITTLFLPSSSVCTSQ